MAEIVAAKSPQLAAALCFLWIWPYVFLFKNHAMVLVVRVVVWQWCWSGQVVVDVVLELSHRQVDE